MAIEDRLNFEILTNLRADLVCESFKNFRKLKFTLIDVWLAGPRIYETFVNTGDCLLNDLELATGDVLKLAIKLDQ